MVLDPCLESDSTLITDLKLCQARLNHNAAFPWILLIPRYEGVCEITGLEEPDRQLLMEEIVLASHVMQHLFQPTKLNIASLGNIVPQLHVHVIARYSNDKAWPGPVWNSGVMMAYTPEAKMERIAQLKDEFLHQPSIREKRHVWPHKKERLSLF
jgi:diadenosine tetraphosphate (Ap4A) HIT family hydrolase